MEVTPVQLGDAEQAQEVVREAGRVFDSGGLVIFPTETVYGLGASAASDRGVAALLDAKSRDASQPFTIHMPDAESAGRYIDTDDVRMRRAVDKLMPGPITLIVEVDEQTQRRKLTAMRDVLSACGESSRAAPAIETLQRRIYHQGTVGLRCPGDAVARQVLAGTRAPVAASSANKRGQAPPLDVDAAVEAVGSRAELIIDGGRCRFARPSTIVRLTRTEHGPVIKVEREGVYDERTIRRMLRWTALFVCTGNTCRSPMAAALARQVLAEQRGITPDELEAAGLAVESAGAFAAPGSPATPEAADALAKMGVDLSGHRSQPLTHQLISQADVIYCMTATHHATVLSIAPHAAPKTFMLDPDADIEDPIGGDLSFYQRCAQTLRQRIEQRLKEQQP